MEHLNISQTIKEVCEDKKIPYYSPHLGQAVVLMDDVNKLDIIFLKVKEVISELEQIKRKHYNMPKFITLMDSIIIHLQKAEEKITQEEHTLVTMKKKLKRMGR